MTVFDAATLVGMLLEEVGSEAINLADRPMLQIASGLGIDVVAFPDSTGRVPTLE